MRTSALLRNAYAKRWETSEPTPAQLLHAAHLFTCRPPKHIWSALHYGTIPPSTTPEVAFLGRSNVGKSSLLNALISQPLAHTSSRPGRTRVLNGFSINPSTEHKPSLTLVDLPGYGHASHAIWGEQIEKYLTKRTVFRRAFVLIDAVHGFKDSDHALLEMFARRGVPFQVVLSKIDRLRGGREELEEGFENVRRVLQEGFGGVVAGLGEVLGVGGLGRRRKMGGEGKALGIEELRWAVVVAAGLEGAVGLREG